MKKLLIINLCFAGLFITSRWIDGLFFHGLVINWVGMQVGFFCGLIAGLLFLIGLPVLFVINLIFVVQKWRAHKLITLVPMLILGLTIFCLYSSHFEAMGISRFNNHLADYNSFVALAAEKQKAGDWNISPLPKEYRHLGYVAKAFEGEPNTLYLQIFIGNHGVLGGHRSFLYTASGDIPYSNDVHQTWRNRMRSHSQRINEHWFRISD
jgi:hypothetical protein